MAMGLRYATQFGDGSPFVAPDAYERMLLNAARGDQALSVSAAELTEACPISSWIILEDSETQPLIIPSICLLAHLHAAAAPDRRGASAGRWRRRCVGRLGRRLLGTFP